MLSRVDGYLGQISESTALDVAIVTLLERNASNKIAIVPHANALKMGDRSASGS